MGQDRKTQNNLKKINTEILMLAIGLFVGWPKRAKWYKCCENKRFARSAKNFLTSFFQQFSGVSIVRDRSKILIKQKRAKYVPELQG
jgi:hypothetical protein